MVVQNFLLLNGGKKHRKCTARSPLPGREIFFFLDLAERGNSNDIAHGSITQVS